MKGGKKEHSGRAREKGEKKNRRKKKERLFAKDTVTKQTLKSNPIEPVSLTEKKNISFTFPR